MIRRGTARDWGGLGEELGSGGQANVYELSGNSALVAKVYKGDTRPSDTALNRVIQWRASLPDAQRTIIDDHSSWPQALLLDDAGNTAGVVLPAIPTHFYAQLRVGETRKVRPRELGYMLYQRKATDLGVEIPPTDERVHICREWLRVFDILDSHGVVFGDISMKNLLWSANAKVAAYLIDCDTAQTDPPKDPSPWTQDWDDPHIPVDFHRAQPRYPPDLASDRYKIALVVYRVLTGRPTARPPATVAELRSELADPVPPSLLGLFVEGTSPRRDDRPRPTHWLEVIDSWLPSDAFDARPEAPNEPMPTGSRSTDERRRRHAPPRDPPRRPVERRGHEERTRPRAPVGGVSSTQRHRKVHRIDETTGGTAEAERPRAPDPPRPSVPSPPVRSSPVRRIVLGLALLLFLVFLVDFLAKMV